MIYVNDEQINNLVKSTKNNQKYIFENCISNGERLDQIKRTNNKRKFNLIDFYYLFHRSIKSSIIREWNLQLLHAFCLFSVGLFYISIFPNDIGSDPECSISLSYKLNLSEITELVYDAINGKRSKAQMNVNYLVCLFLCFGFVYVIRITFVFPDEIKVSFLN